MDTSAYKYATLGELRASMEKGFKKLEKLLDANAKNENLHSFFLEHRELYETFLNAVRMYTDNTSVSSVSAYLKSQDYPSTIFHWMCIEGGNCFKPGKKLSEELDLDEYDEHEGTVYENRDSLNRDWVDPCDLEDEDPADDYAIPDDD